MIEPVIETSQVRLSPPATALWSLERAASPIIGTAIHNGHHIRSEALTRMALDDAARLREEDPFTAYAIQDVPNRIVFHRSRFEIDINRARDGAIYLKPEQSWGLQAWRERPSPALIARSLRLHDAYYAMLRQVLDGIEADHGHFVLLDVHSYNHRRAGPDEPPTDQQHAPDINIGTFSMDRERWVHIVDPLMEILGSLRFRGRFMDVRENVAFEGKGEQTRFIHEHFPLTGCAIAIEFKKFFMDEWTGEPDLEALDAMRATIASTIPVLEKALEAGR
ncbi:MAG TPA: N-formylglutamate amidohydrolase [Devosia sp.]|nr:N-formylglutamate amidohydrolase [Devosia sp.]